MRLNDPARASISSPVEQLDRPVERPRADPRRALLEDPDRRDHAPGEEEARQDRQPEAQHEDDGAPDDRGTEGCVRVRGGALDEDEPPEGSNGRVCRQDLPAAEAVGDHGDGSVSRGSRAVSPRGLHLREGGEVPLLPQHPTCPGGRPTGCGNPPRRRIRRGRPRSGRSSSATAPRLTSAVVTSTAYLPTGTASVTYGSDSLLKYDGAPVGLARSRLDELGRPGEVLLAVDDVRVQA